MDILTVPDRISNAIKLGESHFREFKSGQHGAPNAKLPRKLKELSMDIAEALVAFANADGGDLLIGVEDDGQISGLDLPEAELKLLLNNYKQLVLSPLVLPVVIETLVTIQDKKIAFFSVTKGVQDVYQLSDGRCMRRKDKGTTPISFHHVNMERHEARSREWDRQFVDGATVSDLDIDLLQTLAHQYLQGLSVERYLQQLGLAEFASTNLRLKRAALLLFAKDIQRWQPRVEVRILKVNGLRLQTGEGYNVISDEVIAANIFTLLTQSWERLRPFLISKNQFAQDARFEQQFLFPEAAIREALVNAITHRDYSITNPIEVFVFDDRMEIKSPGTLLSTISIDSLRSLEGTHESRNVLIAKVLRENKYVRELGEGFRRMFELMRESDLEAPQLYSNTTFFSVTLKHQTLFSTQQLLWLDSFARFELSVRQKRIVAAGMNNKELSPADIYRAMNTTDRDTYDREVTALRKFGILNAFRTNPEAANLSRKLAISKSKVSRFIVVAPT